MKVVLKNTKLLVTCVVFIENVVIFDYKLLGTYYKLSDLI